MLIAKDVNVKFASTNAINGVNLRLSKGELVLISGPSGCGKSTLLRTMNGLIPHHYTSCFDGNIIIDNCNTRETSIENLASKIACVEAEPWGRFFQITVDQEIRFTLENLNLPSHFIEDRIIEAIEKTDLVHIRHERIDRLSGGQLQRLSIAVAIAMNCPYLALDEPSQNLDHRSLENLIELLHSLKTTQQFGIIVCEHRISRYLNIADKIFLMDSGKFLFEGSPEKLIDEKQKWKSALGLRDPNLYGINSWDDVIETSPISSTYQTPLMELKNIRAGYEKETIIQNISLKLFPGEMLALVGDNGSGKTTLGKLISGVLKRSSGEILFNGQKIKLPDAQRCNLVFQNVSVMLFNSTVMAEISFALNHLKINSKQSIIDTHLELMDLNAFSDHHPLKLSTGQKLRLALASILCLKPDLIILDEPVRGQDWGHLEAFMLFIREYIETGSRACILITHEFKVVHHFADKIALLKNGRLKKIGAVRKKH